MVITMEFREVSKNDYWSFANNENDGRFQIFLENGKWVLLDYIHEKNDNPQAEYPCESLEDAIQKASDLAYR